MSEIIDAIATLEQFQRRHADIHPNVRNEMGELEEAVASYARAPMANTERVLRDALQAFIDQVLRSPTWESESAALEAPRESAHILDTIHAAEAKERRELESASRASPEQRKQMLARMGIKPV